MLIFKNLHEQRHKFLKTNLVSLIMHAMPREKSAQNRTLAPFTSGPWHNSLDSWLMSKKKLISIHGAYRFIKEEILILKTGGIIGCHKENT